MGRTHSFNISMPCYIYTSISLQFAANDFMPKRGLSSKPFTEKVACKSPSEMLSKMQNRQQLHDQRSGFKEKKNARDYLRDYLRGLIQYYIVYYT